ncbi:MAG TPA: hypothetical protein VGM29_04905 [Polyangiaceae bacterium]|jgi:hypothetical protein
MTGYHSAVPVSAPFHEFSRIRGNRRARNELVALGVLACLGAFVLLLLVAMLIYPGGNWLDPNADGHRFFLNFFCDLTQPFAISGRPNPLGSLLAKVAMLWFALALGGFFWIAPSHFEKGARIGVWVRTLGLSATLTYAVVPLVPSERFGPIHTEAILMAAPPGLLAVLLIVLGLTRADPAKKLLAWLGVLSLALGAVDSAVFVSHLGVRGPPPRLLPVLQKLAAISLSTWMAALAYRTWAVRSARVQAKP